MVLPRPMLHSENCDFSFSGLKTAVLYALRDIKLDDAVREEFAREFEDAVVEILIKKTKKAIDAHGVQTLVLGGGVSANTHIRRSFERMIEEEYNDVSLYLPPPELTTDNALMIAVAGYFRAKKRPKIALDSIQAKGNLSLTS